MDVAARPTSKGQVTIPRSVREALGLQAGDAVIFRFVGDRAVLARTRNLLDLAGAVEVPGDRRGAGWKRSGSRRVPDEGMALIEHVHRHERAHQTPHG